MTNSSLQERTDGSKRHKTRLHIPNPLASLLILFHPTTALLAAVNAIFYTAINCVQASLSTEFIAVYQYSTLSAGLLYIPFGIATLVGSYISGWILDRDYRIIAGRTRSDSEVENGNTMEASAGKRFPIEHARLRSIWIMIIIESLSVAGYGWCIDQKVNVAVLVIMSICIATPQAIISNVRHNISLVLFLSLHYNLRILFSCGLTTNFVVATKHFDD
jgi:hypothetical protein